MKTRPARPVLEEFEPRILYSADFAPAALAGFSVPGATEQRLLQAQETPAASPAAIEIAFVDMSLPDAQSLIDDLQAQRDAGRPIEIVRIEAGEDGITRIGETLADRADVSAVHVLSHGSDGVLQLGNARLDAATLLARAGELAQWSTALTADADLLIYGCDVAASASGGHLLANLATLTGADVAASSDLTGAAARGGDWALEFASGTIQAGSALSSSAQQAWNGLLLASTNETLVNQTTANTQATIGENRGSQQAVALDAAGNYVVVWTSLSQDGAGQGVYARRFDSAGAPISGEIRVNVTTNNDQKWARVASDAAGNFVVTWTSENQDGTPTSVYMRRFNASGVALTAETRVNTTATGAQTDSVIAMNGSNGDYVVAWQGEGPGDSAGIFFRRFNADGTAKDATDRLANLTNGGAENDPAVTMASDGKFVIVWEAGSNIYAQRFDAAGASLGTAFQIDSGLSPASGASVASDAAGNFAVAYRTQNVFSPLSGVWAKGFNADGTLKFSWTQVDSGDATSPSIDMANDGSFVVVYEQTGTQLDVFARKYNADGSAAGAAIQINQTSSADQSSASVAVVDGSNFVVVWSGNGPGDTNGVFARQFSPSVQITAAQDTYINSGSSSNFGTSSSLVVDRSGGNLGNGRALLQFDLSAIPAGATITGATLELQATANASPFMIDVYRLTEAWVEGNGGTSAANWTNRLTGTAWTDINGASVDPAPAATWASLPPAGAGLHSWDLTNLVRAWQTGSTANYGILLGSAELGTTTVTYRSSESATPPRLVVTYELNVAPVITSNGGGASAAVNVAENATAVSTVTATDADLPAQTLTYSISGGADAARFSIDAGTGVLSFVAAPNYEAPTDVGANNVYNVTVLVSDGTLTDTQAIAVTVTPANDNNPVITSNGGGATAAVNVAENATAVTTVTATDADLPLQTLTYSISGGADAARFSINASTGALRFIAAPNYDLPADAGANNVYDVIVQASDGTLTDTQAIAVTVTPVNDNTPVITSNGGGATAAINVAENVSAVTTVTATDADLPAPTLTYSIVVGGDAARFSINASTGALSFIAAPNYEAPTDAGANNVYNVTVRASDGTLSDTQAIAVTVTPVSDINPVITSNGGGATAAVNVAENATAVTTVTATDADLPAQTLTYSISGGADAAKFAINASTGVLSFVAAPDYEVPTDVGANNAYDVTVQASDGTLIDTQAIVVTVTNLNDSNPVITSNGGAATAAVNVAENSTAVTTVAATDADALAALTYSIVAGGDGAKFSINASTGVLSFVAAPNYEAPTDAGANNVYDVTVRVSDGTRTDTQAIAVTVTPVSDNNPVITSNGGGATAAVSVAENAVAVTTVTATDADLPLQTLTYSISGGADAARFAINASTGALSFIAAPNYDLPTDAGANNVYDVIVQASDGTLTDTQAIAVTVTPVNDNTPVITSNGGGATAAIDVAENVSAVTTVTATDADLPAPTLTYSIVVGGDAAKFSINASTGALSFIAAPNYEAPTDAGTNNVYNVTVRASDGTLSVTQAIAVTVSDANEFPVGAVTDANAAANSVAETAGVGTLVGVTAIAVDADATSNAITYTLDNSAGGRFAINAATGVLSVAGVLDYETSTSHAVTVRATSADGSFSTALFTIGVTDVSEAAVGAISDANVAANQVAESAGAGALVGITASAIDADVLDVVSYSLIDNAGGRFAINPTTGVVVLAGALDAETALSHTIVVRADSTDGSFNTQVFTIAVADVNEFAIGAVSDTDAAADAVDENAAIGALVGITASAFDADATNSTALYSLDDSAGGRFAIDAGTGVVTVAGVVDREVAPSHAIVVRATSADGSFSTQNFAIAVNPLNDNAPDITSDGGTGNASISVAENSAAVTTVVATDADLPAQTLTYSIIGGADQALFNIDAGTGVLGFATVPDYESPGDAGGDNVYDVTVQVSDGSLSSTQAISVTVTQVNEASPVITSDGGGTNAYISVAENTTAVTTVVANDADLPAQTLTYSIIGGLDLALFSIDASSGVLSFISAPDFESPSDAASSNNYYVDVQASDGGLAITQSIRVTVTPVNDAGPDITSDGGGVSASINVAEDATAVTTVVASDTDLPAQTLTYGIIGGADQALFSINASTGVLTFASAPDYEAPGDLGANNVYEVTVQVSDGSLSSTQAINVTVNPVNDNSPVITSDGGAANASITLAENTAAVTTVVASDADLPAQTLTYSIVGGADQALFSINASTGVLAFAAAPDYENPSDAGANNVYNVTVQASDGSLTASQSIAVTITAVNDNAPGITSDGGGANASISVAENATAVTTVVAGDADLPAQTLTYSISGGADQARFSINASTGVLSFTSAPDYEAPSDAGANNVYDVTVQVSDGSLSATQAISVTVNPVNDASPVIASDGGGASASINVAENSTAVTTVAATDADLPAQTLTYSIVGGADQALFSIDSSTGVLSFASAPDREAPSDAGADNVYNVTVQANDGNRTGSQAIAVTVTSVNDNVPVISLPAAQVTAMDGVLVMSTARGNAITLSDADAGTGIVEVVLGATQGSLTLSRTGGLTFVTGDGSADASMRFTGTLADINDALDGLRFTPSAGYLGAATLSVGIDDLGNSGSGGPLSASATLAVEVADDQRVNTVTSGNQTEPATAMDAAGNYVVTWTSDGQDGGGKGIYAQRYDAAGGAVGAAFLVNTTTAGDQTASSVAMAEGGEFVVVWTSADGAGKGVFAQRYDANGVAQGAQFQVNSLSPGDQIAPSVAMAADGSFVVAWASDNGSSRFDVYARRYDAGGVAAGSEVRVNTALDKNQFQPAVAMQPSGAFVVAWTSTSPSDGSGTGVYAQRFAANGTTVGGEFRVNSTTAGNQDRPALAIGPDGGFVVAWTSGDGLDGDKSGVFGQRYAADGSALGAEFQVNSFTNDSQSLPSVAFDDAGAFTVAWSSKSQDGNGWGVFAQQFDSGGVRVGLEYRVNATTGGDQTAAAVAAGQAGQLLVVWQGNGPDDNSGIFQRLNVAPNDAPAIAVPGAQTSPEDAPLVWSSANGNRISITDTDAFGQPVQVSLSVTQGTLSLAGTAGLSFGTGTGSGETSMSFTGTLAAVNAALDGLRFDPTADFAGAATLSITVDDQGHSGSGGALSASATVAITVAAVNDAPTLAQALADQTANEGVAFVFTVPAGSFADVDAGDTLNYGATLASGAALPTWLSFDAATRTFSGTPANGDVGAIDVRVTATDTANASVVDDFRLTVANVNDAPVLAVALSDQGATEDVAFSFTVPAGSFADIDAGDALTYSATLASGAALPSWLSFDAATRTFSGTPANADVGAIDVRVTASDGSSASVFDDFRLTVGNVNDAPTVAAPIADPSATQGAPFSFSVPGSSFADVDAGDTLAYSATLASGAALPTWLSFDAATRTFSGTPANADVGAISVRVTATDTANASVFDDFRLTVGNVNDAPTVAAPIADQSATQNAAFSFTLPGGSVADVDAGDVLTYGATLTSGAALPTWLSFDAATQTFSGTPASADVGVIDVRVTATDGSNASVFDDFTLTVGNVNDAPTVAAPIADQSATQGAPFSFSVPGGSFADVDAGDTLTYSATLASGAALPTWLSFDAATRTFSGTPANGDVGVIDVRVTATDGSNAITFDDFTLTVDNVNDVPVITSNGGTPSASISVAENNSTVITVTATDVDQPAQTLSYSIAGGADAARFTIDTATGALSFVVAPDFEAPTDANGDNVYDVIVQVSDGGLTDTQAIAVTVTAVNDNAPVIASDGGGATAVLGRAENATAVTTVTATDADALDVLRFAITGGADAAHFAIDPVSGTLSFVAAPDHEAPADANGDNRYEVTVTVSDGALSAQQALFIDVGNVDEAPTIVTNVLLLSKDGATIVLLGTDPDTTTAALNYLASGQVGGRFELLAAPGVAVTGFSQAQVDAGAVRFVADGSGAGPTYVLRLSDGVSTVTSGAPQVVIQAAAPDATAPVAPLAQTPDAPPAATTTAAAPAAAPAAAAPPAVVPAAPGPLSQALLTEPRDDSFEPGRAPSNSVAVAAPAASTATRDSTVTAVATLAQFALLSETSENAGTSGAPTIDLASALRDRLLGEQLDQQRDNAESSQRSAKEVQAASAALTTGLSVGYVLWLARGGVLVASLMSALPAWAMVDPLPVLAQMKRRDGETDDGGADDDADDPLEKLFSKARQVVARGSSTPTPATATQTSLAEGKSAADINSLEQPA